MIVPYFIFVLLCIAVPAQQHPTPEIFPVFIPDGLHATDHDSNNIFCVVPSPWFTVIIFYLGNYAAHAATLITYPGEAPVYVGAAILYALFFPTSGIVRGLNAIFRSARLPWSKRTDLCAAARAGALCMVVRTDRWRPEVVPDEQVHAKWRCIEGAWCKELPRLWPYFDTSLERPKPHKTSKRPWWRQMWKDLTRVERKIHGTCVLPDNGYYALIYVPRNARVESLHKDQLSKEDIPTVLSSSYSFVRAAIAVVQVLYASSTLYKATKGPQIDQFGYAAFGLTVIP